MTLKSKICFKWWKIFPIFYYTPGRGHHIQIEIFYFSRLSCLKYKPNLVTPLGPNAFLEYVMEAFHKSPLQSMIQEILVEDPDPRPSSCSSSSSGYHSLSGSQAPPSTPTNRSSSGSRRPSLCSSNDSTSPNEALIRRLSLITEDMKRFDLEESQPPPSPQLIKPANQDRRTRYGSGRFRRDPIIQKNGGV